MFFRRRGWTLLALICLLVWLQADVALAGPPIPVKPVITGQGIASPGAAVPAADPEKEAAKEKESAVTVKVQGAFGNHAKQGAWLPLQVDVTNKGPDLKGKLRVVNSNQEQYLVDYTTNAVVPQGSTKRFTLNVPINEYAGSLKVELVTEKGVVAKGKMDLTFHSFDQPVIGLLDRSYNDFGGLIGVRLSNGNSPTLLNLKRSNFPEKTELLTFFDVLVIDDVNLQLNADQAKALTRWVNQGGTLMVGGGPGWNKVLPKLPPELQIAEVTGVEARSLGALASQLTSAAKEPPAGEVQVANISSFKGKSRYAEAGRPLVVEQALGSGKVLFLAFDPALEPLAGWSGTKLLWEDLLFTGKTFVKNYPGPGPGIKGFQGSQNPWALSEALNTIPAMELPSLRRIVVVLILYILLVGPVNYLVLKKLDKREWTWFTTPALAILVIGVIYLGSFREQHSEVLTHQISVVDLNSNSSLTKVTTAIGVFAPNRSKYEVELPGLQLFYALPSGEPWMNGPGQRPEAKIVVEQNPGKTKIELRDMRAWAMRGFTTTGETSLKGAVNGEVTYRDKKWVSVITNNTGYDFTDGVVLSPFGFKKIGPLKAGGKITVDIPINFNNQLNNGAPFFYQIYNPGFNWQGGPGRPPRQDSKDLLRQQILESIFNGDMWQFNNGGRVFFFGWSDQPVQGVFTLQDQALKKFYTSLFKTELNLVLDKYNLQVPPGIITGNLVEAKNVGSGPPGRVYLQPNSEAVFQFEIPEGRFEEMNLYLQSGMPYFSETSLYNWEKQTWEKFQVKAGSNNIKDYGKYLNKNRQLRFMMRSNRDGLEVWGLSISLGSKDGGKK